MISGFQNHLHALYGWPGGWLDNSDILDRGAWSKRKKEYDDLEEQIAAQLLHERQKQIIIPEKINKAKLSDILHSKLHGILETDQAAIEKKKRIYIVLLALMMDD